jgi:hypothetical protein
MSMIVTQDVLPYHAAIRDFLKRSDGELWQWFVSRRMLPKAADEVRFELLKSAYRVDREAQPPLYQAADEVARCLGIGAPLTIYQAQNPAGLNASLAYVPGEAHLVLHGPLANQLTPVELRGILAHELAHFLLWEVWDGELLVVSDLLQALIADPEAHSAHAASWRLFRLYMEIFCDRTALAVTGDLLSVVSALVKVETGVQEISAEAYLRQADEIFSHADAFAAGVTHPEAFIRARALRLWSDGHPERDALTAKMIEGRPGMDELDLLEQERIAAATRHLLDALLWRKWFQTDPVLAHARLFFDGYQPPQAGRASGEPAVSLRTEPDSLRDYYCFLMLDLVAADRELDEPPLAVALTLAEQWGIKPRFVELARQELKLRKNQLDRVDEEKTRILADADRAT